MMRYCWTVFLLAFAQTAAASWQQVDAQVTAMDFLPPYGGLVGTAPPATSIAKWNGGTTVSGVHIVNNRVLSIEILDSNVAYASVYKDGLYKSTKGWTSWQRIVTGDSIIVLFVNKTALLILDKGVVRIASSDGTNFANTTLEGINVRAIDNIDESTFIAAADDGIYRSVNGGLAWTKVRDETKNAASVFADRSKGFVFVGGDTIYRSSDKGATWRALGSSVFEITLTGQLTGAHDCSGMLYVLPSKKNNEVLRSYTSGQFFQKLGIGPVASITPSKVLTFDRGAVVVWQDASSLLSISRNGVDGSIRDSVIDRLTIVPDSTVVGDICAAQPTDFKVAFQLDECISLVLDSIKPIGTTGTFQIKQLPASISSTASFATLSYKPRTVGVELARFTAYLHNPATGLKESTVFTFKATSIGAAPKVSSESAVLFGAVKVDSTKTVTYNIENSGCDTLRISSLETSNPSLFFVEQKQFPLVLAGSKIAPIKISFKPNAEDEYLESLVIQSNAGTDYITLRGRGSTVATAAVQMSAASASIMIGSGSHKLLRIDVPPGAHQYRLFDAIGRLQSEASIALGADAVTVDCESLRPGTYFISVGSNAPQCLTIVR